MWIMGGASAVCIKFQHIQRYLSRPKISTREILSFFAKDWKIWNTRPAKDTQQPYLFQKYPMPFYHPLLFISWVDEVVHGDQTDWELDLGQIVHQHPGRSDVKSNKLTMKSVKGILKEPEGGLSLTGKTRRDWRTDKRSKMERLGGWCLIWDMLEL